MMCLQCGRSVEDDEEGCDLDNLICPQCIERPGWDIYEGTKVMKQMGLRHLKSIKPTENR